MRPWYTVSSPWEANVLLRGGREEPRRSFPFSVKHLSAYFLKLLPFRCGLIWGFIVYCRGQTPSQNRGRTAYTEQHHRTQKPHKMDTRPSHCPRWRSDSCPCISSCQPCARTSRWLAVCCTRVLYSVYTT